MYGLKCSLRTLLDNVWYEVFIADAFGQCIKAIYDIGTIVLDVDTESGRSRRDAATADGIRPF